MVVRAFAKKSFEPMYKKAGIDVVALPGVDFEYVFTHEAVRNGFSRCQLAASLAIDAVMTKEYDEWGCLETIVVGMAEFRPTVILFHVGCPIEAHVACRLYQCPCICLAPVPFAATERIPCFVTLPEGPTGWVAKMSYSMTWQYAVPLNKRAYLARIHEMYGVLVGGADIFGMFDSVARPMICAWSPLLSPRCWDYHEGVQEPCGFLRWSDVAQKRSFPVPDALTEFVAGYPRDRLAYISWGSMSCGTEDMLTRLAVEALREAGVRGVVQGGYSDLRLARISDARLRAWAEKNIFFVERGSSIPHNWLFPRCGVCVHHGGAGTVASCLYAGTPSIVTPVWGDQYYWAQRVEDCGVGLKGPPLGRATPATLGDLIRRGVRDLTEGGGAMAARAERMGAEMRKEDGVRKVVDFVEAFCRGEWKPPGESTKRFDYRKNAPKFEEALCAIKIASCACILTRVEDVTSSEITVPETTTEVLREAMVAEDETISCSSDNRCPENPLRCPSDATNPEETGARRNDVTPRSTKHAAPPDQPLERYWSVLSTDWQDFDDELVV